MKITKEFVNQEFFEQAIFEPFKLQLVGRIARQGFSYKDIDLLISLPKYPEADKIFQAFEQSLLNQGWEYYFSDENSEWGIFHNYQKRVGFNWVGLDIFIVERN